MISNPCRSIFGTSSSADAVRESKAPVVYSHCLPLALKSHKRNKSDEELKAVADKGGPPEYLRKNQERLNAVAKMLADLASEQKAQAEASKERLRQSGRYRRPIVTEVTPASTFYRAEEYHQRYLAKHGNASCAVTVSQQAGDHSTP
jgi:hypothetical protein